jgi:hypothetical protein
MPGMVLGRLPHLDYETLLKLLGCFGSFLGQVPHTVVDTYKFGTEKRVRLP